VKVGFFDGVGRVCRSIDSRPVPLLCGGSSEAAGAALVELLRELTDVEEGVAAGEVWPLGVALGRALVCADGAVGDSIAVAAMFADAGIVDMQSGSRGITSMSWQISSRCGFTRGQAPGL
jgi:hypothetical protein